MTADIVVLWAEVAQADLSLATELRASMMAGIDTSIRESDRRLRRLARHLLVEALIRLTGHARYELAFDPSGRPRLGHGLDVSISHTGGLACAAVGRQCRIGVDVERRHPIEPALYDRVLAPGERQRVAAAADPDAEFLKFWTMKEAAAKADGRGLSLDPRQLLCRRSAVRRYSTVTVDTHAYRARPLDLPDDWLGHIAHQTASRPDVTIANQCSFS